MTDIRDAVARALHIRANTKPQEWVDHWEWLADAALAVARPLIEAEARERALRDAAEVIDNEFGSFQSYGYQDGLRSAQAAILALLPAPTQEPTDARDDA